MDAVLIGPDMQVDTLCRMPRKIACCGSALPSAPSAASTANSCRIASFAIVFD
jgi:hypothetical protein